MKYSVFHYIIVLHYVVLSLIYKSADTINISYCNVPILH